MRRPQGSRCPHCGSEQVIRQGRDETRPRQRYPCKACERRFDDLTGTIFAGHHRRPPQLSRRSSRRGRVHSR
ncbi:MAG: hypothetical protein HYV63_34800 [Candidatus Schekmanbacteria bacterium]|nr:hypothetical protein [Candidatus Schekmanbacteria bacterium]